MATVKLTAACKNLSHARTNIHTKEPRPGSSHAQNDSSAGWHMQVKTGAGKTTSRRGNIFTWPANAISLKPLTTTSCRSSPRSKIDMTVSLSTTMPSVCRTVLRPGREGGSAIRVPKPDCEMNRSDTFFNGLLFLLPLYWVPDCE